MTTTTLQDFTLLPDIVIGRADYRRLTVLALAGSGHSAEVADDLLYELDRAMIIADARVPKDIVRMGSGVRYRTSEGDERQVALVYPAKADIAAGRISVLTPVGAALIGLREGQSITWMTRDGRKQMLTVLDVTPPSPADEDDPGPAAA
jgi:regulator of nucleoside diphosphate kinase